MLAADRQLLDATLRDNLQNLRRLEFQNIVERFQAAIPTATLIAGFTFTGLVELDLLDAVESSGGHFTAAQHAARYIFYFLACASLALSLYVMVIATAGIIFGQRLMIQANAWQSARHVDNVRELNSKFMACTFCLVMSLVCVVGASICVVFCKCELEVALGSAGIFLLVVPPTACSLWGMVRQLHTRAPDDPNLTLKVDGASGKLDGVTEFYVGDRPPPDLERGATAPPAYRGGSSFGGWGERTPLNRNRVS